ncbi:MAG: hypothetical protein AAGJ10_04615 [Bacteroidota bacterium]
MRVFVSLALASVLPAPAYAQPSVHAGAQAYPAGQIAYVGASYAFSSHWAAGLSVGYNRTRRQDFGVQDDERGGGPGVRVHGAYRFRPEGASLVAGVLVDVWQLTIDWIDSPSRFTGPLRTGQTEVTVLQPTASLGYVWTLSPRIHLRAHVALGAEINVRTDGQEVGQGAILLGGIQLEVPLDR